MHALRRSPTIAWVDRCVERRSQFVATGWQRGGPYLAASDTGDARHRPDTTRLHRTGAMRLRHQNACLPVPTHPMFGVRPLRRARRGCSPGHAPRCSGSELTPKGSNPSVVGLGEARPGRLIHPRDQHHARASQPGSIALQDAEQPVPTTPGARDPHLVEALHGTVHDLPLTSSRGSRRGRLGYGLHHGDDVRSHPGRTAVQELASRHRPGRVILPVALEEVDAPRRVGVFGGSLDGRYLRPPSRHDASAARRR